MDHSKVRARCEAEAMEEYCLLACFLWLAQFAFLNNTGPPVLVWQCARLSKSIIEQENVLTNLPTSQSNGNSFSVDIPSFQIHLGLCQVDKNSIRGLKYSVWTLSFEIKSHHV